MSDIKIVAAKAAGALEHACERLSATQQLMLRGFGLLVLLAAIGGAVGGWAPPANTSLSGEYYNGTAVFRANSSLDSSRGELALIKLRLRRVEDLLRYSSEYGVPADLAELIYDVAIQEGLDPDLGFRLVNVESGFKVQAISRAYAYGLTQLQLPTARFYDSEITIEGLCDPETNLRIGFRFLRDLLETYQDINLALLAYNRGPSRLRDLMDAGVDPDNGYPGALMEGYTGGF